MLRGGTASEPVAFRIDSVSSINRARCKAAWDVLRILGTTATPCLFASGVVLKETVARGDKLSPPNRFLFNFVDMKLSEENASQTFANLWKQAETCFQNRPNMLRVSLSLPRPILMPSGNAGQTAVACGKLRFELSQSGLKMLFFVCFWFPLFFGSLCLNDIQWD